MVVLYWFTTTQAGGRTLRVQSAREQERSAGTASACLHERVGCTVGNAPLRPQKCTKFQMYNNCLQRCYMLSRLKCPEGIQLLVVERRTCRQGLCQRRKMGGARGGCVAGVHDSARCTGRGRASQHAQDLKTMTARRKCSRRGSQAVALRTWLSRGSVEIDAGAMQPLQRLFLRALRWSLANIRRQYLQHRDTSAIISRATKGAQQRKGAFLRNT